MSEQSTTEQRKQRTITLTGRPPVKIYEDEWPLIAKADGDSWTDYRDPSRHEQASRQGELDDYSLRVRQHADGRAVVYGVLSGSPAWTGTQDHRGGKLLAVGEDIAAAIEEVGNECGLPESVIRECIADLPVEEL